MIVLFVVLKVLGCIVAGFALYLGAIYLIEEMKPPRPVRVGPGLTFNSLGKIVPSDEAMKEYAWERTIKQLDQLAMRMRTLIILGTLVTAGAVVVAALPKRSQPTVTSFTSQPPIMTALRSEVPAPAPAAAGPKQGMTRKAVGSTPRRETGRAKAARAKAKTPKAPVKWLTLTKFSVVNLRRNMLAIGGGAVGTALLVLMLRGAANRIADASERRRITSETRRVEFLASQQVRRLKARQSVYGEGSSTLGGERGVYEAAVGTARARRQLEYELSPEAFQVTADTPSAPVSRYLSSSLDQDKATGLALLAIAQNGDDYFAWREWEAEMRQRLGADGEQVVAIARSLRGGSG